MNEQRMYQYVFEKQEEHLMHSTGGVDEAHRDDAMINMTINSLHDLYSRLYIEFVDLWLIEDPKSIMDFPRIFDKYKKDVRATYVTLKY